MPKQGHISRKLQRRIKKLNASGRRKEALRLRARWNAEQRFSEDGERERKLKATKLQREATKLKRSRKKDTAARTGLFRGWTVSFSAGLDELNRKFYFPFDIETQLDTCARRYPGKRLRVLEIGAGIGLAAAELEKKYGAQIEMHAAGLTFLPDWKKYPNSSRIHWHVLHAGNLERHFKSNSLDFIHSNLGFSHAANLKKAFQQVQKVLKPGGLFLFTAEDDIARRIPLAFQTLGYHFVGEGRMVFLLKKLHEKKE